MAQPRVHLRLAHALLALLFFVWIPAAEAAISEEAFFYQLADGLLIPDAADHTADGGTDAQAFDGDGSSGDIVLPGSIRALILSSRVAAFPPETWNVPLPAARSGTQPATGPPTA